MRLRHISCPKCGAPVRLPLSWMLGIEVVFACPHCRAKLKTGYRMGALLSALALVAALVAANIGVWLFSSFSLPLFVVLILPLWLLFGLLLRRGWLQRNCRKSK